MTSRRGLETAESIEQRLGPELKRLREASGISLRTLAERARFSPRLISSFRSSWSRARIDSLMAAGKAQPLEAIMVAIETGGSSGAHAAGVSSDQLAVWR